MLLRKLQLLNTISLGLFSIIAYLCNACHADIGILVNVHQLHTGGISANDRDIFYGNPDHNALIGDHHNIMVVVYEFCSYNISGLLGDLITEHAFTAAILGGELLNRGALAHAILGYDQKLLTLGIHLHADYFIPFI